MHCIEHTSSTSYYGQHLNWRRVRGCPVPKILKMPRRLDQPKQKAPAVRASERPNVVPFQREQEDGLDAISRWVSLADKVLSNEQLKKRA